MFELILIQKIQFQLFFELILIQTIQFQLFFELIFIQRIQFQLVFELILKRKSFFKDDINPIPSVFAPISLSLAL